MCLAFMFTEIGTLTIREEGQGNIRKVKPHNVCYRQDRTRHKLGKNIMKGEAERFIAKKHTTTHFLDSRRLK
jgi:hypothetical protein